MPVCRKAALETAKPGSAMMKCTRAAAAYPRFARKESGLRRFLSRPLSHTREARSGIMGHRAGSRLFRRICLAISPHIIAAFRLLYHSCGNWNKYLSVGFAKKARSNIDSFTEFLSGFHYKNFFYILHKKLCQLF